MEKQASAETLGETRSFDTMASGARTLTPAPPRVVCCGDEGDNDGFPSLERRTRNDVLSAALGRLARRCHPIARDRMIAYVDLLFRTSEIWPDPATYQYLGLLKPAGSKIWIYEEDGGNSVKALLQRHGIRTPYSLDFEVDRGLLVSADGRGFIEREWICRQRLGALGSGPPARRTFSSRDHAGSIGTTYTGPPVEVPAGPAPFQPSFSAQSYEPLEPTAPLSLTDTPRTLHDSNDPPDDRTPVTTSEWPWRAVGVAVLRFEASDSSWRRNVGSAVMISIRCALTCAHVFTDGDTFTTVGLASAARGASWPDTGIPVVPVYDPTSKWPLGIRWVQWYYWPDGWEGDGLRYDYGVLVMEDLYLSPGYVNFGTAPAAALAWHNFNMAGYPKSEGECANAIDADGLCGGYMYRQFSYTTNVGANYAFYDFDVQEGQSGAPVYVYDAGEDDRIVYILHKGSEGNTQYGKRIRAGNFDAICNWIGNWPSSFWNEPSC